MMFLYVDDAPVTAEWVLAHFIIAQQDILMSKLIELDMALAENLGEWTDAIHKN